MFLFINIVNNFMGNRLFYDYSMKKRKIIFYPDMKKKGYFYPQKHVFYSRIFT